MHVDFSEVKKRVSLLQLLERYDVKVRHTNGSGVRAKCPFPSHEGGQSETFSGNTDKNVFQCFSCGAKGNVLDFVQRMEGGTIKESAEKLAMWYPTGVAPAIKLLTKPEQTPPDVLVNIPLKEKWSKPGKPSDGRLKDLTYHPYLAERGFSEELCKEFGVGFCSKGKMAGRVVFPISNPAGDVVAYCGRAVDKALEPRWLQPEGFHKSIELYGVERAKGRSVVIVESFWGVLACARADLPIPAVALMGRTMSADQFRLLERFEEYILLLDGGEPGRKASVEVGKQLLTRARTSHIHFLGEGVQPDHLSAEELQMLTGTL